jgi:cytochrome c
MKCQSTLLAAALALSGTGAFAQSVDAGRKAFNECVACHSTAKGVNGVGPSLAGILGSRAGEVEGFRFSGPMKRSGIVWTAETLDQYIANPQAVVPGTRMPYSGMQDAEMRAALVKYLETLK